jgi:transposase-like protein
MNMYIKFQRITKAHGESTIYLKHGCHSTFLLETYSPNKEESEKKNEIVQACCVYHHHHPLKVKKIQNIEENGHKSMIWRIKRLKVWELAFCTFVVIQNST